MTLSAINPVVGVSTPFGMTIPSSKSSQILSLADAVSSRRVADGFLDDLIERIALHTTDIILIL
jgi:hypothetical protein